MKTPDEFNDWLKQQLEANPQEPPVQAWENIVESLELEGAWQGINQDLEVDALWQNIDQRLVNAEKLFWWDKASSVLTTVAVLLMAVLPQLMPTPDPLLTEEKSAPPYQRPLGSGLAEVGEAERPEENTPASEGSTAVFEQARGSQQNRAQGGAMAPSANSDEAVRPYVMIGERPSARPGKGTEKDKTSEHAQQILASGNGNKRTTASQPSGGERDGTPAGNQQENVSANALKPSYPLVLADINTIASKLELATPKLVEPSSPEATKEEAVIAKATPPAGSWRIGVGGAGKLSFLLNEKTFDGMEKSSLTTSLPAFRKSFSLQAEKGLSSKVSLLTDLVVHHEAGQRYEEYAGGEYGTTDTKLRYSQLNALLAFSPKSRGFSTKPHTRWLAGLSGGWLHQARMTSPLGVTNLTPEYTRHSAGMLLGFEYVLPLNTHVWMSYGVRSYLDLLNIYAGNEDIPAHFRSTRSSAFDFTLSFKYELGK